MSSTAIISKMLSERMQLHSPHGRQIMGVLLFQDLAVIPLLVLIPALALSKDAIAAVMIMALLKAAVVLAVVLLGGQRVMRPLFNLVARQKSSELFVLFVLFVALAAAWITQSAGLSLALGAFLAGMLISETEYRYQVEDYIKPFRDVLLGFFFVTIGMLLDWHAMLKYGGWVVAVFALMIAVKFLAIFGLARALGNEKPDGAALGAGPCAGRRVRLRAPRACAQRVAAARGRLPGGAHGEPAFDAPHADPARAHGAHRAVLHRERMDAARGGAALARGEVDGHARARDRLRIRA
jgi:CPA2 family monovalent cation:H+ antiporter-2